MVENNTNNIIKEDDFQYEKVKGNQLSRMWHSFKKRKVAVLGLVIVIFYVLVAIFADRLAPYDPTKQDLIHMLETPSADHILGTDEVGRDLFSRIIYGARISMKVGFMAVGIAFAIGVPLGIISGYFGGKVDMLIMRAMDILLAFPGILLSIVFVSILGPSLDNAILSVGIYTVPNFARTARSETLAIRNNEYIEASKAVGSKDFRIIFSHILLNIVAPKLTDTESAASIHRIVYFICLPSMMFISTYTCDLSQAFDVSLTVFLASAITITFFSVTLLVPLFVKNREKCGILCQGLLRGNIAAFGLPVVLSLCSTQESAKISLSYACIYPLITILAISGLKWFQGEKRAFCSLIKNAVNNPIAMGTLLGVICNLIKLPLPNSTVRALTSIGQISTPLAFMLLGASLAAFKNGANRQIVIPYVPLKLVVIPLFWIFIATVFLGFRGGNLFAVMGVFAVPSAISSVSTAKVLGYEDVLSEELVAYSTMCSVFTIILWIIVLKLTGLC